MSGLATSSASFQLRPAHDLVLALIVIGVTVVLARAVPVIARQQLTRIPHFPTGRITLIVYGATIGIWLVGVSLAVGLTGLSALPLFTLGSLGLAVGLAVQNVLMNVVDGLILLWEGHLGVGMWIIVGGETGRVEALEARVVRLTTASGETALVPNSVIYTSIVVQTSEPAAKAALALSEGSHASLPPV